MIFCTILLQIFGQIEQLFPELLTTLSDPSDEVRNDLRLHVVFSCNSQVNVNYKLSTSLVTRLLLHAWETYMWLISIPFPSWITQKISFPSSPMGVKSMTFHNSGWTLTFKLALASNRTNSVNLFYEYCNSTWESFFIYFTLSMLPWFHLAFI